MYRHNYYYHLRVICFTVFQSYTSTPSLTPDDDVFKHLALTYSRNHPTMNQGVACKAGTPTFNNGITNGAAWYPLTGKNRSNRIVGARNPECCVFICFHDDNENIMFEPITIRTFETYAQRYY